MSLIYTNGTNGLFDVLGKGFYALETLMTARTTTVPAEVDDFTEAVALKVGSDFQVCIANVPSSLTSWQSGGTSLASVIATACQNLIIEYCQEQDASVTDSLANALDYLLTEMDTDSVYVDASTVSLSLATDADNVGDVQILYTERNGEGQTEANALAEDLDIEVTSSTATLTPSLLITGNIAYSKFSEDWPGGSGVSKSITAVDPSNSLLSNGDFQDATIANVPDNWIIKTGTSQTVKLTNPCVQTLTITGTPTGGSYVLYWTNGDGIKRASTTLAYNASAGTVQTALRTIPGLELVTVTGTGTSPNYTHTITFTGVGGNVSALTYSNNTTGGTLAVITTTYGRDGSYTGVSLAIVGNGSELTTLYHPITLTEETVYFCHFWLAKRLNEPETSSASSSSVSSSSGGSSTSTSSSSSKSSTSTSSASSTSSSQSASESSQSTSSQSSSSSSSEQTKELKIEIVDAIDGNILHDSSAVALRLSIDLTDLPVSGHFSEWFSFRLPKYLSQPVYLRIRLGTALDADTTIFIDEMAIIQATQVYSGGPWVAAVNGNTYAAKEDNWTLTVTNDRGGEFQEWFNRCFNMADRNLLLPTRGTTNIGDALIV